MPVNEHTNTGELLIEPIENPRRCYNERSSKCAEDRAHRVDHRLGKLHITKDELGENTGNVLMVNCR
jgi:hypothetical protein